MSEADGAWPKLAGSKTSDKDKINAFADRIMQCVGNPGILGGESPLFSINPLSWFRVAGKLEWMCGINHNHFGNLWHALPRSRSLGSRIDLEAVAMGVRTAMHHAGSSTLTGLLRFSAPPPELRAIPCSCGRRAQHKELRQKTESGIFWTVRRVNAIIALRCARTSGRFEDYWEARRASCWKLTRQGSRLG